jgi:2-succinyl-6-hydroxy-2,4-cyclohexadiene-1-carboxylate synthase
MEKTHTLVAPDLPGHGDSDAVRADLPETAGLVADAVRAVIGDQRCDLLGYSLGARVGLHLLLEVDEGRALSVGRAVLIGPTAGIEDGAARQVRRRSDDAAADALEASGDVEGFLDRWLGGPLFGHLGPAADRGERGRNSAIGLASSLRLCGTGTQQPLWDRLGALSCPLLALAGTDDIRFGTHALRMSGLVPSGVATLVPGGGHAVHLAQPALTARLVEHWLGVPDPD